MPTSPGTGRRLRIRHRKPCRRSWGVGTLKLVMSTPWGLKLRITCVTVPSLPAVSIPCRTTSSERLRSAYRRWCSSNSTSSPAAMSRWACLCPPLRPGVESGSTLAIRNWPSTIFARNVARMSFFATRAKSITLFQLDRDDVQLEELFGTQDKQGELGADPRLHHQPLQVAGPGHAGVPHRDDHVARVQLTRRGRAPGHDFVDLDSGLAAESIRHRGWKRSRAS